MSTHTAQGIYSPLPQSLSDSESDKEMQDMPHSNFSNRQAHNGVQKKLDNSTVYHNGYSIPNHIIEKPKPQSGWSGMSPIRKLCFIFSVALCFITVFVFLWAMPCTQGTCPVKISNWDQMYRDFELKGKINIVQGVRGLNLVVMYRNANSTEGGAISVLGHNGVVAWYIHQTHTPSDMNCDLVDVNGDGILDCLLLGQIGVEAVEPLSGKILWHVHTDYEKKPITNMEFPTVVPDLDGDGIRDLIMKMKNPGNRCIVVSGKTGRVLYDLVLSECKSVQGITYYEKSFIYLCSKEKSKNYYRISTSDLRTRVYNRNLAIIPTKLDYKEQPSNVYMRNGCKLIIDNIGKCPDCKVNITLVEEKTDKILWGYYHTGTFAMHPSSFSFKPSRSNLSSLKGHINGFIIKFWQWSLDKSHIRHRYSSFESKLFKRSIPQTNSSSYKLNYITERVVLITFNDTNIHVTNSSSLEVMQICNPSDKGYDCQPDLANQNDSLLIADLDNDGSQELISYSSTFDAQGSYHLISNIKVICLEAELPKLYEVAK